MKPTGELGLIAGHTRSSKEIYYHPPGQGPLDRVHAYNVDFTDDDLFDAMAVFDHIALEELRIDGKSQSYKYFAAQGLLYRKLLQEKGTFEKTQDRAQLKTSLQIRDLGKSLAAPWFA